MPSGLSKGVGRFRPTISSFFRMVAGTGGGGQSDCMPLGARRVSASPSTAYLAAPEFGPAPTVCGRGGVGRRRDLSGVGAVPGRVGDSTAMPPSFIVSTGLCFHRDCTSVSLFIPRATPLAKTTHIETTTRTTTTMTTIIVREGDARTFDDDDDDDASSALTEAVELSMQHHISAVDDGSRQHPHPTSHVMLPRHHPLAVPPLAVPMATPSNAGRSACTGHRVVRRRRLFSLLEPFSRTHPG